MVDDHHVTLSMDIHEDDRAAPACQSWLRLYWMGVREEADPSRLVKDESCKETESVRKRMRMRTKEVLVI